MVLVKSEYLNSITFEEIIEIIIVKNKMMVTLLASCRDFVIGSSIYVKLWLFLHSTQKPKLS